MQWRGRRQSINFIDLRLQPKKLTVIWSSENGENWASFSGVGVSTSSVILGVDGVFYADLNALGTDDINQFAGAEEIKIVVDDANYRPSLIEKTFTNRAGYGNLTTGQKNALRDVVKNMLRFVQKKDITISGSATPEGTTLLGFVQSVLNDN